MGWGRLPLLYLPLLGGVRLLKLLRLLSVALLHLLFLLLIVVILDRLLVFFFLLLLQLLVLLGLPGGELVLLLLVFLVGIGVARAWRGILVGLQLSGIVRRVRRRSLVFAPRFPGRHDPGFEVTGFRRRCNRRHALVGRGAQLWIAPRLFDVLGLRGHRRNVVLVGVGRFLRRG